MFSNREIALLHLCIDYCLANIEHLEEIADENIADELEQLKVKLERK